MKPRITNGQSKDERAKRILDALNTKPSVGGVPATGKSQLMTRGGRKSTQFLPKTHRPDLRGQTQLYFQLKQWLVQDADFYLSFGGAGDALIMLAACWDNPRARPVFFTNGNRLTSRLFDAFGMKTLIHPNIMGQPWTNTVLEPLLKHPNFKPAGHLPVSLDYSDWKHKHQYFIDTMITETPWRHTLGVEPNPFQTSQVVVICPSGSTKDKSRQRFITNEEYQTLAQFYLDGGCTVYTCMSEEDIRVYKPIKHPHAAFVSADKFSSPRKESRHDAAKMLRYINSASLVLSPDTWMKTYSLLAGIPTIVFMTRWNGRYRLIGEDVADYVFLHPAIWKKIKFAKAEEFVKTQKCLESIPVVP